MSILFRKYFWVINLVTITLCALFAAKAVGKLVDAKIPHAQSPQLALPPPEVNQTLGPANRDITQILSRNIFCSTCEKVKETPLKAMAAAEGAAEPVGEGLEKTTLNLKLVATLISEEDVSWSMAVILDMTEDNQGLFTIGSQLPGNATVTDIQEQRVLLLNGGRREYLSLLDETPEKRAEIAEPIQSPRANSPFAMPPATPGLEAVAKGIRKVGEGRYEIQRSALNKILGNTTLLARSARIVPSMHNGQPNGFKLYAIRPGSLYSLLGMFNGDTINAINGHAITTPDKALEVYTKLRNASHLSIEFARRGNPLTHEYTIR